MKLSSIFLVLGLALTLSAQEPMVWQQRTTVGSPGLVEGGAMAFDEQQGVMLLFGGDRYLPGQVLGMVSNELWQYNGTTWQRVTVTGTLPQARNGHSMVYDPVDERVLMFGGDAGGGVYLGDLWAFEFSGQAAGAWVQLATLPSAGRTSASVGFDVGRDVLIVTGGIKQGTPLQSPPAGSAQGEVVPATRETWLWDRAAWSAGPPSPEYINGPFQNDQDYFVKAGPAGGVVAHHAASGKTMLLSERRYPQIGLPLANVFYGGGASPLYLGGAWEMNIGGITSVAGGGFPRHLYTSSATRVVAAYDPVRRRVVAFGAGRPTSEEFTGVEWAEYKDTSTPDPITRGSFGPLPIDRTRPAMAHDTLRGVTVFFGGKVSLTEPGDTWELVENPSVPFVITTDLSPTPLEPCQGESFTLTGAVAGVGPFKVRWYRDAEFVSITAGFNLVLTNVNPAQTGSYTFVVEDSSGRQITSAATPVFVHAAPVITVPPALRRVVPGESFSLQVHYTSTLPVTVQWFRNGILIPGATLPVYTKSPAVVADSGNYTVALTTRCITVTSVPARVMVGPVIVQDPVAPSDESVGFSPVIMTLGADGVGTQIGTYTTGIDPTEHPNHQAPDALVNPLKFVWRHEGVPLVLGPKYTITSPTTLTSRLVVNTPDYEDEGYYDCVVTDISGPAYSQITHQTLLVLKPLAPPYLTVQLGGGPDRRTDAGMVYDSRRGRMVMFGGIAYGVDLRSANSFNVEYPSNDTWEWDGQIWVKRNPATLPPPLVGFGIAYDPVRARTVIFGGYTYPGPNYSIGTQVLSNAVWEWDGTNWTQAAPAISPVARTQPRMCYDTVRRETLMIGGNAYPPSVTDPQVENHKLWAWNGGQWTQRASLPTIDGNYMFPQNSFTFDQLRSKAVILGVFSDNTYPVWEWNGTLWARIVPSGALRITDTGTGHGTPFYDPVRRMIGFPIVGNNFPAGYGDENSTPFVAYWNGTSFIRGETSLINEVTIPQPAPATPLQDIVPGPIQGDLLAFDTARRCLVWWDMAQFRLDRPANTLEMHFSAKVKPVHFPVQVMFAPNQNINLRVISAGQRGLIYQWFKGNTLLLDDAHWSGANTATLKINAVTAADEGDYNVRITNVYNQVFTQNVRVNLQPDGVGYVVQGSGLVLSWPGATGILETSPNPNGPWTSLYGAEPPYSVAMDEDRRFYRVRYP